MALSLGRTDASLLTTTTNPVLQAQGSDQIMFLRATVCNTDSSARTVTVYRAPTGGSPTTATEMIWDAQSVGAGQTVTVPIAGQTLIQNDQLFAKASVASVVNLNIGWCRL